MQNNQTKPNMQELQKIAQAKAQRAAELFENAIKSTPFPGELSQLWRDTMTKVMMNAQPMACNFPLGKFIDGIKFVRNPDTTITLQLFQMLNNALEIVTVKEIGITPEEYILFLEEDLLHIGTFREAVEKIKAQVDNDVEQEFKMKAAVSGEGPFKAIKGEA